MIPVRSFCVVVLMGLSLIKLGCTGAMIGTWEPYRLW
jgi:hypothetical protein